MIREFRQLLNKIHKTTDCIVFDSTLGQDEVSNNKSFFVYETGDEIERGNAGVECFKVKFYLSFITTEKKKIDKFAIIKLLQEHAIIFERTSVQQGKIQNLDKDVQMITFEGHHIERGGC